MKGIQEYQCRIAYHFVASLWVHDLLEGCGGCLGHLATRRGHGSRLKGQATGQVLGPREGIPGTLCTVIQGQLAAERYVDEEALLPLYFVVQVEKRIVAAAAHRRVRRVTRIDLQRMLGARRRPMLRNIATQRGEHRGLQQHIGRCAQHSGHRVLVHKWPAHRLHVYVTIGTDQQLQTIQNCATK